MKSRSTTFRLAAIATAGVLALSACGGGDEADDESSSSDGSSSTAAETSEDFTNDVCEGGTTSADTFKAGGILPITGNLAFLGPPEIAGVGLAVNDINAAGGVGGADACHQIEDSGDATDLSIAQASAGNLVSSEVSVVVGAASSSVTEGVVQTFTDAGVVQISPANTAVSLSGVSPFYFRTAPPDTIQGNALGNLIASDGYSRVAFITFSDTYGTGLRDVVQETIEASGGECTYGCTGDGDEFPPGETQLGTTVQAAVDSNPDAIVVLAFDETKAIVPALDATGFDMSKTYYTDGNTASYEEDFEPGVMEGAQGTIPGADASEEFKSRASGWAEVGGDGPLSDYSYTAESYDATILAALAAVKGGSTDPQTIRDNLVAVSGGTDGEECTTYADCVELLDGGSEISYTGPSGIGPLNEDGDPTSAFIGIYSFDENNVNVFQSTVEGALAE